MADITKVIKNKIAEIEKRENVRILYACESGSRAWGFASEDSDYDVRFIYFRPLEEYLRLDKTRDVIEAEINEVYDINGWDLKKMFGLLARSNVTIYEWADSPIVYKTTKEWESIKTFLNDYFSEERALYHYVSMCKNNIRSYFRTDEVILKKYLYILRPALACEWIMKKHCPPPTDFNTLRAAVLPKELDSSVDKLLYAKTHSTEKKTGHHLEDLDFYIREKVNSTQVYLEQNFPKRNVDWNLLNKKFLEIVKLR